MKTPPPAVIEHLRARHYWLVSHCLTCDRYDDVNLDALAERVSGYRRHVIDDGIACSVCGSTTISWLPFPPKDQ